MDSVVTSACGVVPPTRDAETQTRRLPPEVVLRAFLMGHLYPRVSPESVQILRRFVQNRDGDHE